MARDIKHRISKTMALILAAVLCFSVGNLASVQAIGDDGNNPPTAFYAVWDDSAKSISFVAEEPSEGTYEEVTAVKDFIQSHKDDVKAIDFAFTNTAGQSEKIVLGESEGDRLFANCSKLTTIDNLTNLDTSKANNMYGMFGNCGNLASLDLSGFDTSKVTNMSYMFSGCEALASLSLSGFDTSNVTNMSYMFSECEDLASLDVSSFDTSKVTDMSRMFNECHNLTAVDVSGFDTGNVTNFRSFFRECFALQSVDVSNFDTSKAEDLALMFYMCKSLKAVDVSNFNTANSRSFYFMFGHCYELTELDASSFTSPNVRTDSGSNYPGFTAFAYLCPKLKSLDIRNISSNSYSGCFQNGFTSCAQLERLVLGENTILETADRFAGCGLSGNWAKETDPETMFTTADLIDKYSTSSSASPETATWIRYIPEGHYYRTDGTLNQDNMWEVHTPDERFKGYCLNKFRSGVSQFLDRVQITNDAQLRELLDSNVDEASLGYAPLGNSIEEALVTLLYYGWPNDKAGIQAKYGLSDDEYMEVTQNAIWDFVDRYDNKSGPENQTPAMLNAYNELLKQRYANIPEKYELYIYTTWDKRFQNLISIRSLTDGVYGGVEVFKQNQRLAPLSGAEFTIYDANTNEIVQTMTSGNDGYASVCETDSYRGLPAGDYYVKETTAPSGYQLDNSTYYFSITESDKIVTLGKYGSPDEPEKYMIFTDKEDTSYKGGGISIKKVSDEGEPLIGAEFTIYKNGSEVTKIISDEEGIAQTGKRDLPLGDYTIKETKPPAGYEAVDDEKSFTIANDNDFLKEEFTFVNSGKGGKVTIEAKKSFKNGKLKGDDFTFQLQTMDGEVLQEVKNDKDGNVKFEPITYSAEDQGYVNYKIVEVKGDDKDIIYDAHEELVTVTIIDIGSGKLECTAIYDEDGAVFKNTKDPYVEKSVNDGNKLVLKDRYQDIKYTINTLVPDDAITFEVIDDLPGALDFTSKDDFVILVDGEEQDLYFTIDGNKFSLLFDNDNIKDFYGSEIEIHFSARIKDDADLSKYVVDDKYSINNIATIVIDNSYRLSSMPEDATVEVEDNDDGDKSSNTPGTTQAPAGKKGAVIKITATGDDVPIFLLSLLAIMAVITLLVTRRKGN